MDKDMIKRELENKIEERKAIVEGEVRITKEEEEQKYNLGRIIYELRRKLY